MNLYCDNSNCKSFLSQDEMAVLENKKSQVEFLANEVIFKQGALNPHIFLIYSGYVKVYIETGKTKRLNIYVAKKGDFISLSGLFNSNKHKYSASAFTDSTLCILDKKTVYDILNSNNRFLLFITAHAIETENRLIDVVTNISIKQMRGKLATALLYLTNEDYFQQNLTQYSTRQDLAEFAGITVENTVTLLKEFERDNIIELHGKKIKVLNSDLLLSISIKG
jgi:CRP/FNR family transcriptional regulator, polysaccharide utilization system transcription regulator